MKQKRFSVSPIRYVGGKHRLAPLIINKFPNDYRLYLEPFCGAASVFFAITPQKGKVEVLNDAYGDLVNFFRVVQLSYTELIRDFQYELISRERFNEFVQKLENSDISNLERAKMFFYLQKTSFGGHCKNRTFGISRERPLLDLNKIEGMITNAYKRLINVTIENRDFREVVNLYDTPATFTYFDPPYDCKMTKRSYMHYMVKSDYYDLADIVKSMKGKFMLSINENSFFREMFKGFNIETIEAAYSIGTKNRSKVKELLIMNY